MQTKNNSVLIVFAFFVLSASCVIAADSVVVFNEIMYHPQVDADFEWVELHNLFAIDVDISKWSLRGGIKYTFPVGTIIPAKGYLVVTDSPDTMKQIMNPAYVHGPFTGNLSNSGEEITLYNNGSRVMDTVDYSDGGDWPVAPDGSGMTLAKRKPTSSAQLPQNWTWSDQAGGTPGRINFPGDDIKPLTYDLIGFHDDWRYDDSGTNKSTLWRYLGYNDATWKTGPATFYTGQDVIGDTPTAITTLYSTGCDDNGDVLPPGQADPHYFITSSGAPATVMQNHSAWAPNDSMSSWVGLSAQGTDIQPGGDYSFSTSFDLNGWIAGTAQVSFSVAVDNELLDVKINGVSTGTGSVGHDAFRGPFTISSGFVSGVNRIDFLFQNWDVAANPMGINIKITGTAIPVIGNTEVAQGPVTHYFRKTFQYNGDSNASIALDLNHLIDDGAVFYLNGKEFYRYNMPDGTVNYLSAASSDITEPHTSSIVSIPVTNMTVGTNILGVEVHQSSQDDDVLFAAAVSATENPAPPVESIKVAFNEITSAIDSQFRLELVNYGNATIDLADYVLVCAGTVNGEYVLPASSLNAGDHLVLDSTELGFSPADEDRLFLYVPDKTALLDAAVVKNSHRGRYPEGIGRWQYPDIPTWGQDNSFDFQDDVVINEIMYNHCYVHGQEAQYQINLILKAGAAAKTLVPSDDSYGSTWTGANEPFDDSGWDSGQGSTTGIGYERSSSNDYDKWIGTDVEDDMHGENRSVYVRIPFTAAGVDNIDELNLRMLYDDAFIAYINGREVARSDYVPATIQYDSGADDGHEATSYESFDITEHKDALLEGTNILAIHGFNYGITSSDMIILPELEAKQQTAAGTESGESSEEWIELYNKGGQAVDLSGWELKDEVDFEFPQGTVIDAGEYIIIANDPLELAAKYPDIRIVGEYDGRLTNKTARIELVDNNKNIADEVRYYDGKPWPGDADGRNASLELRDPDADNSKAAAWNASDEGSKTSWKTYTYRGTAAASAVGPDGQWHEFILGLLDAGEILLDNISVIEDPDGSAVQLIQNGTFESGTADKWRLLGNHIHSEVIIDPHDQANHVLRFIATGSTEHQHNHVETTLAGGRSVVNGRDYEISFRAKWIAGSNQLNSRLYFNRLAKTTLIEVPEYNGSPGIENSRYETNIGPAFSQLSHYPPVPSANKPTTVSITADDPDGVSEMILSWRIDGQGWNSLPMNIGIEGLYQGQIPALSSSTVVQFYVTAIDGLGATSTFPPEGPDSRALYKVEDYLAADNGLNNFRIIILADDYNWMHTNINLMSNDRVGATVIYNESEIFYDVGVRLKSSQRHRHEPGNVGFNLEFPPDNLFCGIHETVAIDRSEGTYPGQQEMLINLVMNRVGGGQLSKYSDLIKVIAPSILHTSSAELQLSRFRSEFLNSQFENGSDGEVYEYELIYYPYQTQSGDVEDYKKPQPDYVIFDIAVRDYGNDKENYRWQFLKKNNRSQDYYQSLIDFAGKFGKTGSEFNDNVADLIDVDQWLNSFAIAVASGSGDNYGCDGAQHNAQFYIRPSDGRALFFPHDLDAFYSSTRPLKSNSDLMKIISNPGYERLYYGHVYDVINTAYNRTYMQHWTDQFGDLIPSQPFGSHLSFIGQRSSFLLNEIAKCVAPGYPFEITDYDSTVADSYAVISGRGWINIKEIYLQGFERPLELSWTKTGSGAGTTFQWSTAVPLEPGVNELVFLVYNFRGDLITTETITIISTVVERPLRDYLKVTEIMYNPIGGKDYEFIEFYNSGPETLDLTGLKMVEDQDISFDFTNSAVTSLGPGEYVVIVSDLTDFSTRYDTAGMKIAGRFSGKLSDSGETLTFVGMWDLPIMSFEYNDSRGWPLAADGGGHSIVPLDRVTGQKGNHLLDYGGNWRDSTYIYGSPGKKDPERPAAILINEIMAHTDYYNPTRPEYDSNDWIELYNASTGSVHMVQNQWFLSDDIDNLKKWSVPETTIPAGTWISFDEISGFHNPVTQGFGLDKAGEQLFLSYLPGTSDDRVVDCVRFKAQENYISLGRFPDGGDFWFKMPPSRNSTNNTPLEHIVISELMYSPRTGDYEYIELYNPADAPITLWDSETDSGWRLDGGISYVFPSETIIPPSQHLVIVPFDPNETNLAKFKTAYGNQPAVILGPYSGGLSNRCERVALEKPEAADIAGQSNSWAIVDEVIYFNQDPWPDGADGTGKVVWRRRIDGNGNDPTAWSAASPKPGTVVCDYNFDGRIDLDDWAYLAQYWLLETTDPGWNPEVNLDGAGSDIIDLTDLLILVDNWLWSNK